MPRYLYTVPAIVMAFFLVVAAPLGRGLTDAQAYARQGMYGRTAWQDGGPYRWRSIGRWFAEAMRWWSSQCARDLPGLLVGFVQRGTGSSATADDERDLAPAIEAALASHIRWGRAV